MSATVTITIIIVTIPCDYDVNNRKVKRIKRGAPL